MNFYTLSGSCGAQYLWIGTIQANDAGMEAYMESLYAALPLVNLILFTDNIDYKNAERLVKYIEDNDLGTVARSEVRWNPTHQNGTQVISYSWSVNRKTFALWGARRNVTNRSAPDYITFASWHDRTTYLHWNNPAGKKALEAEFAQKKAEWMKEDAEAAQKEADRLAAKVTEVKPARKRPVAAADGLIFDETKDAAHVNL